MDLPKRLIAMMQRAQNLAAKVTSLPERASLKDAKKQLHWRPIDLPIERNILCLSLYNAASVYLTEL